MGLLHQVRKWDSRELNLWDFMAIIEVGRPAGDPPSGTLSARSDDTMTKPLSDRDCDGIPDHSISPGV